MPYADAVDDFRAITGNLDPLDVLYRGTPRLIEAEVERLMTIGKANGAWIFNTGEMNPREVPEENMRAMMKAAKSRAKCGFPLPRTRAGFRVETVAASTVKPRPL